MRRTALNALLLIVLIYSLPALYIQWGAMAFHNAEYPMWRWKAETATHKQHPAADLLILGDSRTLAGLIPQEFGKKALSLAIGGATPITNFHTLSHYLQHNPAPKRVILSFTPVHLEEAGYFWERPVKFQYLSIAETLTILKRGHQMGARPWGGSTRPTPYLRDLASLLALRLNLPWLYRHELANAWLFGRLTDNRQTYEDMASRHGHSFFGTAARGSGLIEEAQRTTFTPSPLLTAYLDDLLALCKLHGIAVTLVVMPISEPSYAALAPAYRGGYLSHLRQIQSRHPEITVVDNWLVWPLDNFGDSSHLNAQGAARFSRWVKNRLASIR